MLYTSIISSFCQNSTQLLILIAPKVVHPFDEITVICPVSNGKISVSDSKMNTYFSDKVSARIVFMVGGAAGTQTVSVTDKNDKILATKTFFLEAKTNMDDGGKMTEFFRMLSNSMLLKSENNKVFWHDRVYHFFVSWVLDNNNTATGMKYFSPYSGELVDLFRETQCKNGMIWSFVKPNNDDYHYNEVAYGPLNYFRKDSSVWFARQPNENHVEYNYVNLMYQHWKSSGNTNWMKTNLESAAKALDYCMTDTIRWSRRFKLLKRPYCIDSWDFQVDDKYTPKSPINPTMLIVPGQTKFGVFFGDNTGYYEACNQLAEMYDFTSDKNKAKKYRTRGQEILSQLIKLSWNGRFFTHFIDEDTTVIRHLGVDEKSQIAQGNMYSINRGLPHEMNVDIINTYLNLKKNLPVGSPGEWYSIYPPFEKGFEKHDEKWQYMNGGIAGHAIGELALGAFENGFEKYGADILNRFFELGKKFNNKIYFAYSGAFPTPPEMHFKPVDLSKTANMNLWDTKSKTTLRWMNDETSGNDLRNLPLGQSSFKNIKFNVIDPSKNNGRAIIAVSNIGKTFPSRVQVQIKDTAKTVYLMHTISGMKKGAVAGSITFLYHDGTSASKYIFVEKDVVGWWFPTLKSDNSGIAWTGSNPVCTKVGVCWSAIQNPNPSKQIDNLQFDASLEGGIYAVLAVTLADQPHYVKPKGESYGGPDNWAAANGMKALIEGLSGIKNTGLAYENSTISPRWTVAGIDSVAVTANLAASNNYVSYQFKNDISSKTISMKITGSGKNLKLHLLLPELLPNIKSVLINDKLVSFQISKIESSNYLDVNLSLSQVQRITISY